MDDDRRIQKIEKLLEYSFKNKKLLLKALTHASRRKDLSGECNERLEFLGDSVLGLVVTELLFRLYPDREEGELTRLKGVLVSRRTLAILVREFNIQKVIKVGQGIPKSYPDSLLANLFEAIVGAYYLDSGLRRVKSWLTDVYRPRLDILERGTHEKNNKSILQQFTQKIWQEAPSYVTEKTSGPEHDKHFVVSVELPDGTTAKGEGASKKIAEQKAAAGILRVLKRRVAYKDLLMGIQG